MTYPPMGGPGYPHPGGPYDPVTVALADVQRRSRRRLTIVLSCVVVILALVLAFAVNQVYVSKTGKTLIPGLTLRAADDPGPDPFTNSVALVNKTQPALTQVGTAESNGVRAVNGTDPGLYATTGTASCDAASLGNQLAADPAAARAWAGVQGISTSDIPWYLNSLTPVVLTADTWVTDYSYRGGDAVAYQAVLQSGTPVFVDAAGVPRAVCACGNPLRPPAAAPIGGYRVTGNRWPGYTVNNTYRVTYNNTYVTNQTIVNQAPPAPAATPVLRLVDLRSDVLVDQPVGGILELPEERPGDVPDFRRLAFDNNVAPVFESDETAHEQGLATAGSAEPAEAMTQRAVENGNRPATDQPSGTDPTAAPRSSGSEASGASGSIAGSPTNPPKIEPTVFRGSGDAIGKLVYREADGRIVTCTLPAVFTSTTVEAAESDCTLVFKREDLLESHVTAVVDADRARVWTITPVNESTPIEVIEAQWQTLATSASTTPSEESAVPPAPSSTSEVTPTSPSPEVSTPSPAETSTADPESSSAAVPSA